MRKNVNLNCGCPGGLTVTAFYRSGAVGRPNKATVLGKITYLYICVRSPLSGFSEHQQLIWLHIACRFPRVVNIVQAYVELLRS